MQTKKKLAIISALALVMSLNISGFTVSADDTVASPAENTQSQQQEETEEEKAAREKAEKQAQRERVLESIRETKGSFRVHSFSGWDNEKMRVKWKVYRIGTRIPTDDEFIPEEAFEGNQNIIVTKDTKAEDVQDIAYHYKAIIDSKGISPDYTFACDSDGMAEGKIPYGLYLFVLNINGKDKGEPIIVEITDWNEIVDIYPKFNTNTATGGGGGGGGGGGNTPGGGDSGGGSGGRGRGEIAG